MKVGSGQWNSWEIALGATDNEMKARSRWKCGMCEAGWGLDNDEEQSDFGICHAYLSYYQLSVHFELSNADKILHCIGRSNKMVRFNLKLHLFKSIYIFKYKIQIFWKSICSFSPLLKTPQHCSVYMWRRVFKSPTHSIKVLYHLFKVSSFFWIQKCYKKISYYCRKCIQLAPKMLL